MVGVIANGMAFALLLVLVAISQRSWRQRIRKALAGPLAMAERHTAAILSSIDSYMVVDQTGRIVDGNAALGRMTGYSEAELKTLSLSELEAMETPADIAARIARIMASGSERFATRWRRKDGGIIDVEASVSFTRDHFFVFMRDISEKVSAVKALRESEERFRQVINEAPFPMIIHVEDGEIILVNQAWTEITGYSHADIPSIGAWVQRAYGIEVCDHMDELYSLSRRRCEGEYVITTSTGDKRVWEMSDGPLNPLPDGRRLALSMANDVTDRKAHEVRLKSLNRVLRMTTMVGDALIRAANEADRCLTETELFAEVCRLVVEVGDFRMAWVGLAEHDEARTVRPVAHAGVEDGYLSQVRISWRDDTPEGRGPGGMAIRTGTLQVNHDTAANAAMSPWRVAALAREYRSCIVLPLKNRGGVFGELCVYASEVNAFSDEEIALFMDLTNDIALGFSALRERRRRQEIEASLNQIRKLEALGYVAGGVAHDFNNLLGAIMGFAQFIAEDTAPGHPSAANARRILLAGRRGKSLIDQILTFAHRTRANRIGFRLADLVRETESLLLVSIPPTTHILVEIEDPDASVEADHDQLGQVLMNLCINAHHALEENPGTVTIAVTTTGHDREIYAMLKARHGNGNVDGVTNWSDAEGTAWAIIGSLDPADPPVALVVTDTGIGMDAATMEHAFVPFFTTHGTGRGTGLGLAITHKIVLAHDGAMVMRSRPGEGTRCEVVLSRAALAPSLASAEPPSAEAGMTGRVLLVDDDPDFGDMLLTALERCGLEVASTASPLEALEAVRENPGIWDLVVSDQIMPEMRGTDLIRAIKVILPDVPCILCSGYGADLTDAMAQEAGAFAFLHKPFDIKGLMFTMRRALSARTQLPPG
ncbi:MAG: PAS domain S-box protein [Alphaproteobacteria bacterium]|nr:PAS domain S-box protein [Alphaproteobacteria bacterium]